jgi:hypothetical protein
MTTEERALAEDVAEAGANQAATAEAQPTRPGRRYPSVSEPGMAGSFGRPDRGDRFPGVLALGGSDGGVPEYLLDLLVPEGFAGLALAYFGADGTQPSLVKVPLDRIERGLRWLAARPDVATLDGRIAVVGASKGGELALLVAATFPDLVGPVAAYTPSSVAWAGIDFTTPSGRTRSSWSYRGTPLPFVPYPEGLVPPFSDRGIVALSIYERGLDNTAAVRAAEIPVERAAGPLLLVSGGDDCLWPAERMCRLIVERMRRHGRGDAVRHLNYPEAGHALFPSERPSESSATSPMPLDLGGDPEADRAAHLAAWPVVVSHLRGGAAAVP